jgi:hypothetical protein
VQDEHAACAIIQRYGLSTLDNVSYPRGSIGDRFVARPDSATRKPGGSGDHRSGHNATEGDYRQLPG